MEDYLEKPLKKKKKSDKEPSEKSQLKAKAPRNFKIIDDDIDLNSLNPSQSDDILVDLLDPEGPMIVADDSALVEKPKVVEKLDLFTNNRWIKVDLCENEDGDLIVGNENDRNGKAASSGQSLFKKRGEKFKSNNVKEEDSDGDLDIPRRKADGKAKVKVEKVEQNEDEDSDLDIIPRRRPKEVDLSPERDSSKRKSIDETKVRVRKLTKEEEAKKAKDEEVKKKYSEWKKGLVQVREQEEKLKEFVHEADKPLARHADDKDLDRLLKSQDREDDPMLEYMRSKANQGDASANVRRYKGPPPPPNRYNILPGSKWDGVDRSNGFEKKHFESIMSKKAKAEEAYKWSVEDM